MESRHNPRVIEAGRKALQAEIKTGNEVIRRGEDLPFVPVVQQVRKRLPVITLIDAINLARKKAPRATEQPFVPAGADV